MSFTMDLSKDGLEMFFKPYQVRALRALWSSEGEMSSRDVWEAVGSEDISRASIIFYLDAMTEAGILDKSEITGKGGHRGMYTPKHNEVETKEYLKKLFTDRLKKL